MPDGIDVRYVIYLIYDIYICILDCMLGVVGDPEVVERVNVTAFVILDLWSTGRMSYNHILYVPL